MKKYYLHIGDAQQGPFTLEELRSKAIRRSSAIWFEGLPDWTAAEDVPELKSLFSPIPPPFESQLAKSGKEIGKSLWQLLRLIAIVMLCFIALWVFIQWKSGQNTRQDVQAFAETQKTLTRNNISSYVTAGHSAYTFFALGGIKNLSIVVTNNSGYMLDHVKVKLSYIKADGSLWKDVILDFSYVPANNQQSLPVPDTDRGIRVTEQILSIQSTELGMQ